ncbi:DedA family protein, partial [Mycobacterium kansasii]
PVTLSAGQERTSSTRHLRAAAERFFSGRGAVVVVGARFIDGLRQANGIVAGAAHLGWWRFLAFNTLGGAAWVALRVLVGDYYRG